MAMNKKTKSWQEQDTVLEIRKMDPKQQTIPWGDAPEPPRDGITCREEPNSELRITVEPPKVRPLYTPAELADWAERMAHRDADNDPDVNFYETYYDYITDSICGYYNIPIVEHASTGRLPIYCQNEGIIIGWEG